MSRPKLSPPQSILFTMERTVGLSNLNYAKHLDSVAMIQFLHESRLQFLASLGFSESNIFGLGLVVTGMEVDYRAESFANDLLLFDVGVDKFNKYGLEIVTQVTNSATENLVCIARVGVVFFDFDNHAMAEVPRGFRELLSSHEAQVA